MAWEAADGSRAGFQLFTRVTESAHYAFSDFDGLVPSRSSDQFYVQQAYTDVESQRLARSFKR